MREVVFDTETTGFGAEDHRVIEIGCIELVNRLPTGKTFHTYLNPERKIDFDSFKVHGISDEKVATAPRFAEIAEAFLEFVADAPLVAHNAEFDFSFINSELARCGRVALTNPMVDTLAIARAKLPGQRHNLDALCNFYRIDNSGRTYHGGLLDAQLLADVYVELLGGLQGSMTLSEVDQVIEKVESIEGGGQIVMANAEELAAHAAFVAARVPGNRWDEEKPAENTF